MFKIAWRNIWRNKRRTILTISAIVFSVFFLSTMLSLQEGTYANNLEKMTRAWNGKIRIFNKGYFGRESLSKSFFIDKKTEDLLNSLNVSWAERIDGFGLISFKDKTYGVSITGINVKREKLTTDLFNKVIKGRFLKEEERNSAILGNKLAENLKVKIGDEVAVIVQGKDGSIGAKLFNIVGIFRTHMLDLDRSKILININDADELFSMNGTLTTIVVYFSEKGDNLERIKNLIQSKTKSKNLEVFDWKQIMPEVLELIEFDRISGYLSYAILIIIIAFGLLNTIYMAIFERRKEIGVLRAIGMKRLKITSMIILESIYMGIIGAIIGFALSYPVILHFKSNPIRIGGKLGEMYESFMFIPEIHFLLSYKLITYIAIIIMIVSVFMAIIPSLRAIRENLADQLKFEK